jgi:hypothetical protein
MLNCIQFYSKGNIETKQIEVAWINLNRHCFSIEKFNTVPPDIVALEDFLPYFLLETALFLLRKFISNQNNIAST